MKKILFVLPFSALLTYCSSSKVTQTIPAGVSNLQVNGSSGNSVNTLADNNTRDWGYSASRDTSLTGTWQLEGMQAADGNWKSAESWIPKDSSLLDSSLNTSPAMDSTTAMNQGTSPSVSKSTLNNSPQTASNKKNFGGAVYDTSIHYFDTAAFRQTLADQIKPYAYWQRLPQINMMPKLGIFTGNTGCNTMSGGFNFSGNDIRFDNKLRVSKMGCNEYDETAFLSQLLKVDNYGINNDVLELKAGNTTLLTFKRKV